MNKQATGTTYPILPLALVDCMSVIPCFNKPGSPSSTAEHVLFMQFTWVIHKLPNTSQSCFETMNILHPVAATPWSIELWDGRKACFKGNFVMALQACLSLFCIGEGRERKKVYPVRASTPTQQAAMHARSTPCFPSLPPSPNRRICIIKGEESSHHSQSLLLPIRPKEVQGDGRRSYLVSWQIYLTIPRCHVRMVNGRNADAAIY